tara:strand:- start:82 stop:606 length:525 start_codon:yes stop_codon:yes gene_type:complete
VTGDRLPAEATIIISTSLILKENLESSPEVLQRAVLATVGLLLGGGFGCYEGKSLTAVESVIVEDPSEAQIEGCLVGAMGGLSIVTAADFMPKEAYSMPDEAAILLIQKITGEEDLGGLQAGFQATRWAALFIIVAKAIENIRRAPTTERVGNPEIRVIGSVLEAAQDVVELEI